jgi:hypothetical protein
VTLSKTKNGIPNKIFNSQEARWFMGTLPGGEIDDGSAMKGLRAQSAGDQKIEG